MFKYKGLNTRTENSNEHASCQARSSNSSYSLNMTCCLGNGAAQSAETRYKPKRPEFDVRWGHTTPFNLPSPSGHTTVLGSIQPLTDRLPGTFPGVKGGRLKRKADNLTAIYEPIVHRMWEPRSLTTMWVSMVWHRDSFCFFSSLSATKTATVV
jgi:hypothetical protein